MDTAQSLAAGPTLPQSAVPAYFSDAPSWDRLTVADRVPSFVVANPASGPGSVKAPWIASVFDTATANGLTLVGYTHTRYGDRPVQEVLDEISHYRSWYGINRIFLDETPYLCDRLAYYRTIADVVHQNGGTLVLNPGMNPESCWNGVAEVVVNFEGSATTYETWTPAPWTLTSTTTKFWHIVYNAGLFDGTALLELASQRKAAYAYLTDDQMPNPFDRLPGDQLWKSHRLAAEEPLQAGMTDTPIRLVAPTTTAAPVVLPPTEPGTSTDATPDTATTEHRASDPAAPTTTTIAATPATTISDTTTTPTTTAITTADTVTPAGPPLPSAIGGTVFGPDAIGPAIPVETADQPPVVGAGSTVSDVARGQDASVASETTPSSSEVGPGASDASRGSSGATPSASSVPARLALVAVRAAAQPQLQPQLSPTPTTRPKAKPNGSKRPVSRAREATRKVR